jgi:DNA polymerase-3 subunit delta'
MLNLPWLATTNQQLVDLVNAEHLHHALLLSGPDGVGKHELAELVARHLMCQQPTVHGHCGICKSCLLVNSGHHPDLQRIVAENSIGVDQIREISHFMQSAAQQGGARVVLIPHAEKMTEAAANALLKTLEEPGDRCFLLLQTAHEDMLLPTIRSRCQRWVLSAQFNYATQQWLAQQSQQVVPEYLLDFCGGAPLKALSLLQSNLVPQIDILLANLQQYIVDGKDLLALVKKLEAYDDVVTLLSWFIRQQCIEHNHPKQIVLLQRFAQWCRDEQQILGQNKNLALTTLMLDFYKLLH